jgi:ProP effector
MTDTPIEVPVETPPATQERGLSAQAVLEKLFSLYPHLFGAEFLPLQLGVFQELLAQHPQDFERSSLKAALGLHTRSTRYLQCVAAGKQRHDLMGNTVGAVAPEHVCLALLELFRRKQGRSKEDLRPKLRRQLAQAYAASGLSRQDYLAKIHINDEQAQALLNEALDGYEEHLAKQEALCRAYEASGKTLQEFAEMYGMNPRDVGAALDHKASLSWHTAPL